MKRTLRRRVSPPFSVRRQLGIFYGVAAVTMIVLSVGAVIASQSVARNQALQDAIRTTSRLGDAVGPLLTDVLVGNAERRQELDRALEDRMSDGDLRLITVWNADGGVVYSTDPNVIGRRVDPPAEVTAAITDGVSTADFEDEPEVISPAFQIPSDGLVEVYVPLPMKDRPGLAFEAYYAYARVAEAANSLLWQMIPLVLVPLVVLQIIQVPIAASLARRVRRQEAERSRLLEQALSVSEKERIRIAADLHDGPIQDLAGIGYALGAVASAVPEQHRALMDTIQGSVHRAIESLRRLMVDLYPPDLTAGQLPATIADLAVQLRGRGIAVEVTVESVPEIDNDIVTALYRVARESLANVVEHAQATRVDIILGLDGDESDSGRTIYLKIIDDGVGLDPRRLDRRAEGHLGIRLLKDRVQNLGGTFTVASGSAGGTVVSAVLPVTVSFGGPTRSGRSDSVQPVN